MRTALGLWVLLLVPACGSNVTVEQSSGSGSGGATTATSGSSSGAGGTGATSSSASASSSSTGSGGGVPDCVTFGYVAAGLPCGMEGTTCRMVDACCHGSLTCQGAVWTADAVACAQPCRDCGGGLTCGVDAICVHDTAPQDAYQCVKNPCPDMPDCSCAASACAMNFQSCKAAQMYTVTCGN